MCHHLGHVGALPRSGEGSAGRLGRHPVLPRRAGLRLSCCSPWAWSSRPHRLDLRTTPSSISQDMAVCRRYSRRASLSRVRPSPDFSLVSRILQGATECILRLEMLIAAVSPCKVLNLNMESCEYEEFLVRECWHSSVLWHVRVL